jgi:hypothetical protein
MFPENLIVSAKGTFKQGLAVRLKFEMSKKNNYDYTVFLNDEGIAKVSKSELLRSFGEDRRLFGMDYREPLEFFTGCIEAHVLSKEEIERAINASNIFKHYNYPSDYLNNLQRALIINPESNCSANVEQII